MGILRDRSTCMENEERVPSLGHLGSVTSRKPREFCQPRKLTSAPTVWEQEKRRNRENHFMFLFHTFLQQKFVKCLLHFKIYFRLLEIQIKSNNIRTLPDLEELSLVGETGTEVESRKHRGGTSVTIRRRQIKEGFWGRWYLSWILKDKQELLH